MFFCVKEQKGFTLIEIIAVLIILGILASVAVSRFSDMQTDAQLKAVESALAAGSSNTTLSYSKFILSNSAAPTGIGTNNWTGDSGTTAVNIETNLGDFTASYSYNNGIVNVTVANGPSWYTSNSATKNFKIQ